VSDTARQTIAARHLFAATLKDGKNAVTGEKEIIPLFIQALADLNFGQFYIVRVP